MKESKNHGRPFRLAKDNYRENGIYFVTFCAIDRKPVFGRIVGRHDLMPAEQPQMQLSEIGRILQSGIQTIPFAYPTVMLDAYVIMPNHVHLLLRIENVGMRPCLSTEEKDGQMLCPPNITQIIRALKRSVTVKIGESVFQSSFHDHIVRNERDYLTIWQYIENNPAKWLEDRYYFANESPA